MGDWQTSTSQSIVPGPVRSLVCGGMNAQIAPTRLYTACKGILLLGVQYVPGGAQKTAVR